MKMSKVFLILGLSILWGLICWASVKSFALACVLGLLGGITIRFVVDNMEEGDE